MDFTMPPQVEQFREEVRAFVDREWPVEFRRSSGFEGGEDYDRAREFRRKLGEKGWLALSWPKQFGGQERNAWEFYAFHAEMSYAGAPAQNTGVGIAAPTLMHFGSEEQKQEFLPRIASGEIDFCLGYSEPDAGSDLASLQIRAEDDGDTFVINGIKRWTSGAHRSEYVWLAARTDPTAPKHRGISLFMVDMQSPGITVKPIYTMGDIRTNETYWENVRVPRANMVGEKNRGWYYVAAALDFERLLVGNANNFRAQFDRLVEAVKQADHGGRRLKDDPVIRQKIAQISIELEAAQLLDYRTAWIVASGGIPNYEASMRKMFITEAQQRMAHIATQIYGLYGQLRAGGPDAPLAGSLELAYRATVMPTFGGGASELMRNIIATRGMGLPRG